MLAIAGCGSDRGGGGYGGKSAGDTAVATVKSPPGAESGAAVLTVANAPRGRRRPGRLGASRSTTSIRTRDRLLLLRRLRRGLAGGHDGWRPAGGEGASAAKLGTTKRKDGSVQVTYAGHPLYTYAPDKKPGEANGNDIDSFGAEWYALQGNGEEAED